jgi:hypothetical protein
MLITSTALEAADASVDLVISLESYIHHASVLEAAM